VLHAWWGLNGFMRGLCDRLAQAGFVALAPDMFFGKTARTVEEAERLASGADEKQVATELLSSVEYLKNLDAVTGNGLGMVGFSFGAAWALWLAQEKPEGMRAVTIFYGTGPGDYRRSKAAYLGHFAETDPYETASGVKELEDSLNRANRPTSFYTYKGTEPWFFEEDRKEAYHPDAARLAWERTTAFLHDHLESGSN
jgi:carboxymethylenebutenolidase